MPLKRWQLDCFWLDKNLAQTDWTMKMGIEYDDDHDLA
jgi:hypothetical protein